MTSNTNGEVVPTKPLTLLVIVMFVLVCITCSQTQAQTPPETTDISTGPLEVERTQLQKKIHELQEKGVGIKPYIQSFADINSLVKSGGSEDEIRIGVDRLNRAISDQLQTLAESKAISLRRSEPAKAPAPTPVTRYCDSIVAQLKKKWKPVKGVDKDVVVMFSVDTHGVVNDVALTKQSKGEPAAQEKVKQIVAGLQNLGVPPTKKLPLKLVADCCDRHGIEVAEFGIGNDIDFGPYMADVQRRIKRAWFPPKGNESKRLEVIFKIHSNGTMSDLRILTTSGIPIADQAAMKAVQNAAPYRPLPNGSPPDVDICFTFDYNVFKGSGGGGVYRRF